MVDNVIKANWFPFFEDQEVLKTLEAIACRLEVDESEFQVFPPSANRFKALFELSAENVKVVILGQDPYHGAGQANGLAFSVPDGIRQPPSLRNIFKEISRDFGCKPPAHGDLMPWVRQGVLLLNTVMTVRSGQPGSHKNIGWQLFTDSLIKFLSDTSSGLVFLLWGLPAQAKKSLIDVEKHHVLTTVHPSPLSAYRGFIGCGHFSETNRYLNSRGQKEINWCLT
ncbi:MAG: uracil-DNA glycosylase [Bacteroidales bacterium]|nr:uracil-DNA glycosylase [Bacteroidales bacterium]